MGKYTDEIKRLTLDPGARRLGEIADKLAADIAAVRKDCGCDSVPAAPPTPAPAPTER